MTLTWSIKSMKYIPELNGQTNVVTHVTWQVTATESGLVSSRSLEIAIPLNDPFVPFSELTEEAVLAWVFPMIDKAGTEAIVTDELNAMLAPPVVPVEAPLPWVQS